MFRENVRGIRPEIGAKVIDYIWLRQLGEVGLQFPFGGSPREVRVGLAESQLRQIFHHLGAREGLGEEDHLWMGLFDGADEPFPEPERFGMGIVNTKDRYAVVNPVLGDHQQRYPQLAPR